ncbi:hypothetical protein [Halomonas sp. E19]|uniref:hypothetical protein n=1 Tax=unclassified Halomonas TaxID=2609666 RepID=UPI004034AB56
MPRFLMSQRSPGVRRAVHLALQLGLLAAAASWGLPRSPWLGGSGWATAWPSAALSLAVWLALAMCLYALVEFCLSPRERPEQRAGFTPEEMITRSFERRPAVHSEEDAWTSTAREVETEPSVLGKARVMRPAKPLRPQNSSA